MTRPDGDIAGRVVQIGARTGGAGADLNGLELVIANPDETHVAPTVITLDQPARWRDVYGSGIGVRNGGSADRCASRKTDADAGAPVRMGLSTATGGDEAACECQGGEGGCGDLGLGHGGLHPVKFGRRATAATGMGRAAA